MARPKWSTSSQYKSRSKQARGYQCEFSIKWPMRALVVLCWTAQLKHEFHRPESMQSQVRPHGVWTALASLIVKKNTAITLFMYIQNWLLCLQFTFHSWTFDTVCHSGLLRSTLLWRPSSLRGLEKMHRLSASTAYCQLHLEPWTPWRTVSPMA